MLRSCWNHVSALHILGIMSTYKVLDSLEQLDKHLTRLSLRELLLHDDPIEKLAFGSKLQHQVHAISLVKSVLQTQQ